MNTEQHHWQGPHQPKKTDSVSLLRNRGLIYMNIISMAANNNVNWYMLALDTFTMLLKMNRLILVKQGSYRLDVTFL
jgi:hypothetical protein